jgi:catechol 2,3-dioxygenase
MMNITKLVVVVRDIDAVSAFYQKIVGLHRTFSEPGIHHLCVGENVLLVLQRDPDARRHEGEAGLFHMAFLLPSRAALGQWIRHARAVKATILGSADHSVSEAFYLADPEGNGVEVYADRPRTEWLNHNGQFHMPSNRLNINSIIACAGSDAWTGMPAGTVVGHIHLQVGQIDKAEAFYRELGFEITCRYAGGTFFAVDGYHHHIATNIWRSRGAERRSYPSTGLKSFDLATNLAFIESAASRLGVPLRKGEACAFCDPWGTYLNMHAVEQK